MEPHHTTTLVVDFDDTIALTISRDWANAKPNTKLINKLNHLFDSGWTVHVVTARGQLSCNGDSIAADTKYRTQIEGWLSKNGVKYTDLSFNKKLAAYYIDDKGMTPELFVEHFSREVLPGGLSGATVVHDTVSGSVYKTAKNTANTVVWFKHAEANKILVPKIHTVIGDTIRMDYVLTNKNADARREFKVCKVIEILRKFSSMKPLNHATPYSYTERCLSRVRDVLTVDEVHTIADRLTSALELTPPTFGHGDFSVDNLLFDWTGDRLYLIDPIHEDGLYSSSVIDTAKLSLTLRLKQWTDEADELVTGHSTEIIQIHEVGHLCRMYSYSKNKNKILTEIRNRLIKS